MKKLSSYGTFKPGMLLTWHDDKTKLQTFVVVDSKPKQKDMPLSPDDDEPDQG